MDMVELINVKKRYRMVEAVRDVSVKIKEGEFFSLLGPSGCGKTTTLRLIAGFEAMTAGAILLEGRDVTEIPPERRDMGMVFQNYAIFPHMNVFDNIAFGLRMRKIDKTEIRKRVEETLHQVSLQGYEKRFARELSGGEQQRVALARVLVIQPKVLLLDEPLSALDKKLREEMQFWVKNLQQSIGITTIYVTHDQVEAMTVSDTIAVMNKGKVEQVGAPREIYENPRTKFIANFIGESNIFEGRITSEETGGFTVAFGKLTAVILKRNRHAIDQAVSLVLRPEKIMLGRDAAETTENKYKGRVKALTFRGPIVRYLISLEGQQDIIVDSQKTAERSIFGIGDTVDLSWNPEDATVLED